ncbi:hypothetical protein ALC57_01446 [Trachymyrmex cornetzi]|uniref:Uncharacterized protein n=1 Tax=Trachymyrmex cornetzi TaxID=471704 RepID=A0A151JQ83_9HYME|nr:hypothetical protein ALC57_01446 [Trachymyrmex cornetzi]
MLQPVPGELLLVNVRQHRESQSFESRSELRLEVTDQDCETIAMLLLLLVVEFAVAEFFLETVPEGPESAALFLGFDWWELPCQINSVEVIVV